MTKGVTPTISPSIDTRAPCGSELRASAPTNAVTAARFERTAVTARGVGTGERRVGTIVCRSAMTVCVAPGCGEIVPAVPCGFAGIAFSATVEPGDFSARDGKPTGDVDAALCSVDSS